MYYRQFILPIIIASVVLDIIGIFRLIKTRRWIAAGSFLIAIFAYPYILVTITEISDDHLRLWVAMPFAILAPFWLLIGFFIRMASEPKDTKVELNRHSSDKNPQIKRRRSLGVILVIVGGMCWLYGATHQAMSKGLELILLAAFMYCCVVGLYWAKTGEKIC